MTKIQVNGKTILTVDSDNVSVTEMVEMDVIANAIAGRKYSAMTIPGKFINFVIDKEYNDI